MGTTTFTGPVKAGDVLNTTGSTAGTVKNVGFCVMAQSYAVTQAATATATATTICIPANSHILSIDFAATVAFTSTDTLSVGTSATATELVAATSITAIGILALTPGTDATRTAKWIDVGVDDVIIYVDSGSTGSGVGVLTVTYVQAENLTA
jgi:hypothetical protein